MFLRETWYVAALSHEVSRTPLARELLGEKVALYRGVGGEPYAIGDHCPHRFASLSQGRLDGDIIQCPYHGLRFDTAGICVGNPHGDGTIPPRARVQPYPVADRYGYIWIWMGEAARADSSKIPDFSDLALPDWAYFDGYIDVDANYQLVVDNLLDLSHIQFLHPFLSSPEWVARVESSVRQEGQCIYGTNRAKDIPVFPVWKVIRPSIPATGEHWMDLRWDAPSHVYLDIRLLVPGVEARVNNGHFMTPASATRTHYFYRIGRNEDAGNTELTAKLKVKVLHAFASEDEPMIAQQQRNIGNVDLLAKNPVVLTSDNAAIRARRILSQLVRQENERAMQAA